MCNGERRFFHTEKPKDRSKAENELLVRRKFGYDQNLARANNSFKGHFIVGFSILNNPLTKKKFR
jgi:hypothetical protein